MKCRSYGMSDLENADLISPDSVFHIASISNCVFNIHFTNV